MHQGVDELGLFQQHDNRRCHAYHQGAVHDFARAVHQAFDKGIGRNATDDRRRHPHHDKRGGKLRNAPIPVERAIQEKANRQGKQRQNELMGEVEVRLGIWLIAVDGTVKCLGPHYAQRRVLLDTPGVATYIGGGNRQEDYKNHPAKHKA